ncbi:MAG: hypothetical protein AAF633_01520 [Chloroflexota bacterium]
MSESSLSQPRLKKSRWQNLIENPITLKELRGRMRGTRAFVVLTTYLMLVGGFVFLIYLLNSVNNPSSNDARFAGQAVFFTVVAIQAFVVIFMAPAFTSGTISGEKERQTFELLRTTLLSPESFVIGKAISALSYVFLLLFSSIPLISIAFMIGGVSWEEVIISQALLVVGSITFAMLGLYFSSRMKTTLGATIATYLTTFIVIVGIPLVALFSAAIIGPLTLLSNTDWFEAFLAYAGVILSTTNLPATMIISEAFLLTENAVWGFSTGFSPNYWVPSPWYGCLIVYGFFAWVFFRWTVKRVEKIADE